MTRNYASTDQAKTRRGVPKSKGMRAGKGTITSRACRHSRKLLLLYENALSARSSGKGIKKIKGRESRVKSVAGGNPRKGREV